MIIRNFLFNVKFEEEKTIKRFLSLIQMCKVISLPKYARSS